MKQWGKSKLLEFNCIFEIKLQNSNVIHAGQLHFSVHARFERRSSQERASRAAEGVAQVALNKTDIISSILTKKCTDTSTRGFECRSLLLFIQSVGLKVGQSAGAILASPSLLWLLTGFGKLTRWNVKHILH
jgi:hypothetical protein